jgi:putative ribosome biogenesis GTPase RsgA
MEKSYEKRPREELDHLWEAIKEPSKFIQLADMYAWALPLIERLDIPEQQEVKSNAETIDKPVVVLIGKTGTGKSAMCNTLIDAFANPRQAGVFKTSASINSETY